MKAFILSLLVVVTLAYGLMQEEEPNIDVPPQVGNELLQAKRLKPLETPKCNSTGPVCDFTCDTLPDGQHQYCGNCSYFLACVGGNTNFASCPGNYWWDNDLKRCVEDSATCRECYVAPKCVTTGPSCKRSCTDLANGNYQICDNCTSYATCVNGALSSISHCPDGMIWNDVEPKGCAIESTTCIECFDLRFCNSTGPTCVSSCTPLPDGKYQACDNCVMFTVCTDGKSETVFCPIGLYYDDNRQGCFENSDTCMHCAQPDLCENTGQSCIRRCTGLPNGYYQACTNCTSFVSCVNNGIFYQHCEQDGWLWDDIIGACMPSSATCLECEW